MIMNIVLNYGQTRLIKYQKRNLLQLSDSSSSSEDEIDVCPEDLEVEQREKFYQYQIQTIENCLQEIFKGKNVTNTDRKVLYGLVSNKDWKKNKNNPDQNAHPYQISVQKERENSYKRQQLHAFRYFNHHPNYSYHTSDIGS